MVRIISGMAKGRKIYTPKGLRLRPTLDRVKESIFNMLTLYLKGSYVLDLFAGTGNLGLEALSRGAEHTIFIENEKSYVEIIKKNLNLLQFTSARIHHCTVSSYLCREPQNAFNIIFIDPPFKCFEDKFFARDLFNQIIDNNFIASDGLIVIEYPTKLVFDTREFPLEQYKKKHIGQTTVSILRIQDTGYKKTAF